MNSVSISKQKTMISVLMENNKIIFKNDNYKEEEYDLTNVEMEKLFYAFRDTTRSLEKHRNYYDRKSDVYMEKVKRHNSYNCSHDEYTVYDNIADEKYTMIKEDEAKKLVDLLRDKYRR